MLPAVEEEDDGDLEDVLHFVDDTTAEAADVEAAILLRGLSSRESLPFERDGGPSQVEPAGGTAAAASAGAAAVSPPL